MSHTLPSSMLATMAARAVLIERVGGLAGQRHGARGELRGRHRAAADGGDAGLGRDRQAGDRADRGGEQRAAAAQRLAGARPSMRTSGSRRALRGLPAVAVERERRLEGGEGELVGPQRAHERVAAHSARRAAAGRPMMPACGRRGACRREKVHEVGAGRERLGDGRLARQAVARLRSRSTSTPSRGRRRSADAARAAEAASVAGVDLGGEADDGEVGAVDLEQQARVSGPSARR